MFLSDKWLDYEVLDAGGGEKLERWGDVILRRPDPQSIWEKRTGAPWDSADAVYRRSERGGGAWAFNRSLPESWQINYGALRFIVRPTGFKHTGLFPEQAVNWDWMAGRIGVALDGVGGSSEAHGMDRSVRVLNAFAYTGGASLACLSVGASVTHLDAAKGMVHWARENAALSGLANRPCRWIVDDALGFLYREKRRGSVYDAVVMDPPSYGRGSDGSVWRLEDNANALMAAVADVLSDKPLFVLFNAYTTGLQASVLGNLLEQWIAPRFGGRVQADELGLPMAGGMVLPCGASGRWVSGV